MNRFMGKVMLGLACVALMGCGADTEDDTYAVDTAISTESGAETEEEETGAETADENQLSSAEGALLYEQHCAGCHGVDGKGGAIPKDISGGYYYDVVVWAIANGMGGMPSFSYLSDEEIAAIADYVSNSL